MEVAIIDYQAGNPRSVQNALDHLGVESCITSDPHLIRRANRLIFPGVGAARAAMENLTVRRLVPVLKKVIEQGMPFLGICLGAQLLLEESEEDGGTMTLGVFRGKVKQFPMNLSNVKIPHIGWNNVVFCDRKHPLFSSIESGEYFYFVHSYYMDAAESVMVFGRTEYAAKMFHSVLAHENIVATQFHPEKSGKSGLKLLENFCHWNGKTSC